MFTPNLIFLSGFIDDVIIFVYSFSFIFSFFDDFTLKPDVFDSWTITVISSFPWFFLNEVNENKSFDIPKL